MTKAKRHPLVRWASQDKSNHAHLDRYGHLHIVINSYKLRPVKMLFSLRRQSSRAKP